MQSLLSNTCDLFSRIYDVFNEMEIDLYINNKIFKILFKNKSKRKRNFVIYHFQVESKPHEKIDLLINSNCEYLPDQKSP